MYATAAATRIYTVWNGGVGVEVGGVGSIVPQSEKREGRRGSCCCRYIPPPSYCICSGRSEFSSSSSSSHPVPVVLYCTASSLLQLWLQEKHYIVQLGGILGRYAVFIHGKNVVVKRFLSFDENAMSIFVSQERSNSLSLSR